ncbi:MAG TPA: glycoside hydrolase family 2 TIM barrel-domain containing protein [Candidatus Acidoferrales bacterium]|nr:glycoside hydrolase family 2 TIM barrel-domain containing protein [Candidatus Acidoferrales bacterium]
MRGFVLFLALAAAALPAQAGPTAMANIAGRKTISLNGKWRVIVDPYENGYYDFRMQPSKEGYFLDVKARDKSDRVEYDFDTASQLDVPGDWNSQRESLFFYEGTLWYRRTFDYAAKPGTRAFLYFGAANYEAIVFLNGEKLGSHVGGFTPFSFEVTGKVRPQGNSLVVKVDNKRHVEGVPTLNTDWWNYGGLTRDVALVEVPGTFVEDYFVQLKKGSADTIAGWVKLNGARARQQAMIRIPEAGVSASVTTDDKGYGEFSVPARLTLWSPANPKLYDVSISSEDDTVRDRIGFRTIEVKGTEILLNGKSLFLRGVSIHEEAPYRGGRAYSQDDARTLLGWAKEMGCNFVRLAHYPHNENMVREAERMGLLVWSESPIYWMIQWENPATYAIASNQVAESIARDKNRAAIILWSVANETPITDARNDFLRRLALHVRTLDPTRLVTAAMMHHEEPGAGQNRVAVIDDPFGAGVDVLGCNEYIGWYDGLPEKLERSEWRSIYNKPLIMSEFGADALYGMHGDALTRWSEEYQEGIYQKQVAMLNKIPFLRGTTPWVLMDFRSPRRPLANIQDFFNRKGLVSLRGDKKKAFFVLQEYYRSKAD